jgi:hypothetical protein
LIKAWESISILAAGSQCSILQRSRTRFDRKSLALVDRTDVRHGISCSTEYVDSTATPKLRWFAVPRSLHADIRFLVESGDRFSAEITTKRIRCGAFRSVRHLEQAIADDLEEYNATSQPLSMDRHGGPHG